MAIPFMNKDKKLGVADGSARYDLPLHRSAGSGFLTLLVALMSFLAMMALTGSFAMHNVTQLWSSGLENQATIEIPARLSSGKIRSNTDINTLAEAASNALKHNPNVKEHHILKREEIAELVSPWLGEGAAAEAMPLPGLISVKLKESAPHNISNLKHVLSSIATDIQIDTHEGWLNDILRLTGSLKISAIFITLLIGVTTVTAIAGAVQSRMAEFKSDIELLHLMGASNNYISGQFQRHSVSLAFKGSLTGLAVGIAGLSIFAFLAHEGGGSGLMPSLRLSAVEIIALLLLPGVACLITYVTARFTVLRTLSLMPL